MLTSYENISGACLHNEPGAHRSSWCHWSVWLELGPRQLQVLWQEVSETAHFSSLPDWLLSRPELKANDSSSLILQTAASVASSPSRSCGSLGHTGGAGVGALSGPCCPFQGPSFLPPPVRAEGPL